VKPQKQLCIGSESQNVREGEIERMLADIKEERFFRTHHVKLTSKMPI
jgi:hypothetical protein